MKTGKRFRSLIAVSAIALVVGGVFGLGSRVTQTEGQAVEACAPNGTIATGTPTNCTITATTTFAEGEFITKIIDSPVGAMITACAPTTDWVCIPGTPTTAPGTAPYVQVVVPAPPPYQNVAVPPGGTTTVTFVCGSAAEVAAGSLGCTGVVGEVAGTVTINSTVAGTLTQTLQGTAAAAAFASPVAPGVTWTSSGVGAGTIPNETCNNTSPVTGPVTAAGAGTTCTLIVTSSLNAGGTIVKTMSTPAGAVITACAPGGTFTCTPAIPPSGATTVTLTCTPVAPATTCAAGTTAGTVTVQSPTSAGPLTECFTVSNPGGVGTTGPLCTGTLATFSVFAPAQVTDFVGCANSSSPTAIVFPSTATGFVTANAPTTNVGLTLVPPSFAGTSSVLSNLVASSPFASAVECASVIQAQTGTGGLFTNAVPGGTVTYTLNNPLTGGFGTATVFSSVVQILESNGVTFSINCGSATGLNSCQGAVTSAAGVTTPNPALVVHVGFIPGATFSFIGAGSPVFTLTDTYTEYPTLGTLTATASTTINIIPPVYSLVLTANPATIAASPTGGVGATSTLTASLYHFASYGCVAVVGSTSLITCATPTGLTPSGVGNVALLQTGAEPGNVEFIIASGAGAYFTGLGSSAGSAGTVVTVHCGALANTLPSIIIPTAGILPSFAFNSCTTASATLVGTTVGVVTVVANYTGDYTGATAQASTTVNVNAAAATLQLTRGCNEVVINAGAGMTAQQVLALASPTSNVVSIWQFNNSLHAFQALYFNTAGAPTDIGSVGGGSQSVFYCVSGNTTVTTGF